MTAAAAPAVELRDARPDERDAVRALTLRAYAEYAQVMAPEAWAGLERAVRDALDAGGPAARVVAVRGGALVGSVLLYPAGSDAYGGATPPVPWPEVRLLAVPPEARGQGVARLLMGDCVRRARAAGAESLGIHTSRSMRAAMRMYRAMGFLRAPELDFHPGGGELVEAYRLPLA